MGYCRGGVSSAPVWAIVVDVTWLVPMSLVTHVAQAKDRESAGQHTAGHDERKQNLSQNPHRDVMIFVMVFAGRGISPTL